MKVNYPSEEQINSILQSYWQGAGIGSKDLINMTINLIKQLNPEQVMNKEDSVEFLAKCLLGLSDGTIVPKKLVLNFTIERPEDK